MDTDPDYLVTDFLDTDPTETAILFEMLERGKYTNNYYDSKIPKMLKKMCNRINRKFFLYLTNLIEQKGMTFDHDFS